MIKDSQLPEQFRNVISDQLEIYEKNPSVTQRNSIPDDLNQIPLDKPHWHKIPDIICVFVDMIGSTKMSAELQEIDMAKTYQLFTGTAIRLFGVFDAPYIDVRGDGVFALFNQDQPYRAIAAAVTFKTFVETEFNRRIREDTEAKDIGCHIGIDQKTVLVKRLGYRQHEGRTDRQNEVWAGKPVNMAAKLASLTEDGELLVSDRYYKNISDTHVRLSCGCAGIDTGEKVDGEKGELWEEFDLSELDEGESEKFDFDTAYRLTSIWCEVHGKEYCSKILGLDKT